MEGLIGDSRFIFCEEIAMARILCLFALVALAVAGCSGEPETQRVVIEVKGLPGSSPDPALAGLSAEEAAKAEENSKIAYREASRLLSELMKLPSRQSLKANRALDAIRDEYEKRKRDDGILSASKWFREQVEGKSAEDFLTKEDIQKFRGKGWREGESLADFLAREDKERAEKYTRDSAAALKLVKAEQARLLKELEQMSESDPKSIPATAAKLRELMDEFERRGKTNAPKACEWLLSKVKGVPAKKIAEVKIE
jgi:hypothetical protein